MSGAKKVEEPTDLLPLLESGGPDERLFIACACQHRAAFHDNLGCQWVTPAKSESAYSGGSVKPSPEMACTCPTPREVVYIGGRLPAASTEVAK